MERLGIFQMNDSDGIVDDYILYLLEDMRPILAELVIVINGALQPAEAEKLSRFTDKFFYRTNDGFDAIAYKETIIDFLGIEYIREYDELVMINDTFFGPFYPFKVVFEKMNQKKVDFWGLTLHAEFKRIGRYMPEHIQSYFLVIRQEMLTSSYFEKFWEDLTDIGSYVELVRNYENYFTTYFTSHGFQYTAYVEDGDLNSVPEYNTNHYAYLPCTLLDKYGMPVLKRKDFVDSKNISLSIGSELRDAIRWIEKNTDYNTEMIWKNVIRKYNIADLKKNLNLIYVLPEFTISKNNNKDRAVVLAYLTNESQLEQNISYLQRCPKNVDVIVLTFKKHIFDVADKRLHIAACILTPDLGKEYAFVNGCKDVIDRYQYLCFVHDEYANAPIEQYLSCRSLDYMVWENTLNSPGYIENILLALEEDHNLGVLSVPEPIHSEYRKERILEWEEAYPELQYWAKKVGLNCNLDKKKRAFTFTFAFWCKTEAVRKIAVYPFAEEDFEDKMLKRCLKYLIIYAAQDSGSYSGIAETLGYSKIEIENQNILTDKFTYYNQKRKRVAKFARQFEKVYVYGAGYEAEYVKSIMGEYGCPIEGFAVSDSHYHLQQLITDKLIPISKVPNSENIGIIVAMNDANTQDIKQLLHEKNYKNIFYMSE